MENEPLGMGIVVVDDISDGAEPQPIPAVNNTLDGAVPFAGRFRHYVAHASTALPGGLYEGCSCGPAGCSPDTCSCWQRTRLSDVDGGFDAVLFECGNDCSCRPLSCANRQSQARDVSPSVWVFRCVDGRGWGVRIGSNIAIGAFVCVYGGELVSAVEARRRMAAYDAAGTDEYALMVIREHFQHCVLSTHVDATCEGNVAHFINHSCAPNLEVHPVRRCGFVPVPCLFAVRDIIKNEELTFDYGAGHHDLSKTLCRCGTASCRGFLPRMT